MNISTLGSLLMATFFSLSVNAATVSYNGYSLDTDINIVTGGGLEWLQWDETVGQSINSALGSYGADGWRPATNTEMATLLNAFDFFDFSFDTDETTTQFFTLTNPLYTFSAADEFINLFGNTYLEIGVNHGDRFDGAFASFGGDGNGNGYYNTVQVLDTYTRADGALGSGHVSLRSDRSHGASSQRGRGVALVRMTSVVPVPAAAWLFGSALLGLAGIRRRK